MDTKNKVQSLKVTCIDFIECSNTHMLMKSFLGSAANSGSHSTCVKGVNVVSTECVCDSGYEHPKDDSGAEIAYLCVDIDKYDKTAVHSIRHSCKANSQCVRRYIRL